MSGLESLNTQTTSFQARAFEGASKKPTPTKGDAKPSTDTITSKATTAQPAKGNFLGKSLRWVGEKLHIVSPKEVKVESKDAKKVDDKKTDKKKEDERSGFMKFLCYVPNMFVNIFKWAGRMFKAIFCLGSCKSEETDTETPKAEAKPKTEDTKGKDK